LRFLLSGKRPGTFVVQQREVKMALRAEDVTAISAILQTSGRGAVAELRQSFPTLSLTQCDASDMTDDPFATYPAVELYFINTADHCVVITQEPAQATGLILAWKAAP
jgi:hypothetical protein